MKLFFINAQIATIVGGMSIQKQRRLLSKTPHILVATPGRLWELIQEDDDLCLKLRGIKMLIIDEADRMLEGGHFKDLHSILEAISLQK